MWSWRLSVIAMCGMYIALHARDRFGMLAAGITFLISLQAAINIGVVTSALPNKGLALPFISYGGSNLLAMLTCVGLIERCPAGRADENRRIGRGVRRITILLPPRPHERPPEQPTWLPLRVAARGDISFPAWPWPGAQTARLRGGVAHLAQGSGPAGGEGGGAGNGCGIRNRGRLVRECSRCRRSVSRIGIIFPSQGVSSNRCFPPERFFAGADRRRCWRWGVHQRAAGFRGQRNGRQNIFARVQHDSGPGQPVSGAFCERGVCRVSGNGGTVQGAQSHPHGHARPAPISGCAAPRAAAKALGLDADRPMVLVVGGSQGASGLNAMVLGALPLLAEKNWQWLHLTGASDFEKVKAAYAAAGLGAVVKPFLAEMELALGGGDRRGQPRGRVLAWRRWRRCGCRFARAVSGRGGQPSIFQRAKLCGWRRGADARAKKIHARKSGRPPRRIGRGPPARAKICVALEIWHAPECAEQIAGASSTTRSNPGGCRRRRRRGGGPPG